MITLEDLESFTEDDDLDPDSFGDNADLDGQNEVMEQEDQDLLLQDRLLNFWQDVGRGHAIDIPKDMAQPIQQLTTDMENTPEREKVPFTLVTHEKRDNVPYEKRVYQKAFWACVTMQNDTYEQSICAGFMKLMRYICQQNTLGRYLGMTVPIVTVVRTDETRTTLSRAVTVAYHLPCHHQHQPPMPADPDITIETWPSTVAYARPFSGQTSESSILREINAFSEVLDPLEISVSDSFIVAGYTSLAATHRHNEVWFLERH
ncbi:heme-binding protein 1-like [Osmerus mordax]|uniref:heme-binding protein 1-like n=1 Tax=Osmerus mordax TaxID=8014 RepID=UPI0035101455